MGMHSVHLIYNCILSTLDHRILGYSHHFLKRYRMWPHTVLTVIILINVSLFALPCLGQIKKGRNKNEWEMEKMKDRERNACMCKKAWRHLCTFQAWNSTMEKAKKCGWKRLWNGKGNLTKWGANRSQERRVPIGQAFL